MFNIQIKKHYDDKNLRLKHCKNPITNPNYDINHNKIW